MNQAPTQDESNSYRICDKSSPYPSNIQHVGLMNQAPTQDESSPYKIIISFEALPAFCDFTKAFKTAF